MEKLIMSNIMNKRNDDSNYVYVKLKEMINVLVKLKEKKLSHLDIKPLNILIVNLNLNHNE